MCSLICISGFFEKVLTQLRFSQNMEQDVSFRGRPPLSQETEKAHCLGF